MMNNPTTTLAEKARQAGSKLFATTSHYVKSGKLLYEKKLLEKQIHDRYALIGEQICNLVEEGKKMEPGLDPTMEEETHIVKQMKTRLRELMEQSRRFNATASRQ
ncbi:MAG: hypothetical protein GF398_13195 [Chitinivibrionales bacterium]|nr:hypothetical protein [Chitinivibrionales bacterium]